MCHKSWKCSLGTFDISITQFNSSCPSTPPEVLIFSIVIIAVSRLGIYQRLLIHIFLLRSMKSLNTRFVRYKLVRISFLINEEYCIELLFVDHPSHLVDYIFIQTYITFVMCFLLLSWTITRNLWVFISIFVSLFLYLYNKKKRLYADLTRRTYYV